MAKKKLVDSGTVLKARPRRGAASSTHEILPSPIFPSLQPQDASVNEEHNVLSSAQINVPPPASVNPPEYDTKTVVKASAEYQSRLQIVQQLCDAIDAEVKTRSETIRALAAAQYASFKAQLDMQMSKFSEDELNMPLEEYLQYNCSGIQIVKSADGTIHLQKRSSPYPRLEASKRNLQDLLTNARDGASKGTNLVSPCADPKLRAIQSVTSQHLKQEPEERSAGEELSWPEYFMRLQSLGFNSGLTPSLGNHNFNTPMIFNGGLLPGVTPKTLRLPKPGEAMLSINGSPLGRFGKTPASAGGSTRITRTKSRLMSSKRSLRDL